MHRFDTDGECDHLEYFWFTGKSRLARDMHILHGYVQGIAADSRVNELELKNLTRWLSEHREFANRHPFSEIIPRVQAIISDGIVDEEERADLIWLSNKFTTEAEYYDDITSDMQQLQGIFAGILSDGLITEVELKSLDMWVEEHSYLKRCWPYDELESIITHVMKDGHIDAQEHEALVQFFGEFVSDGPRKAVGVIEREVTVSGVCSMTPQIEFAGRCFCFTGASERGSRDYLGSVVSERGGRHHKNLRNDTHYLVVGANGNPCWAFACYGRKVEDAVERRRNGQLLEIVHEYDFWDAVEEA